MLLNNIVSVSLVLLLFGFCPALFPAMGLARAAADRAHLGEQQREGAFKAALAPFAFHYRRLARPICALAALIAAQMLLGTQSLLVLSLSFAQMLRNAQPAIQYPLEVYFSNGNVRWNRHVANVLCVLLLGCLLAILGAPQVLSAWTREAKNS